MLELIRDGRLRSPGASRRTVTYHDPCYLGRHNGIFDEPREILNGIPGLTLREMADYRNNSLCCGGGGGRVWMETIKGERFSDLRLEQARAVGADLLVTACPYCISMFEDSRLTLEMEDDHRDQGYYRNHSRSDLTRKDEDPVEKIAADGNYGDVMIVGGGISGIQAALDMATAGFKVYLVEKGPSVGGHMAQLDKTFPTNDCST